MTSPVLSAHYFSRSEPLQDDKKAVGTRVIAVRAAGLSLEMRSASGTFARGGLDAGSQLLVESFLKAFETTPAMRLCDLGCGWGAIGCLLAKTLSDAHVFACDINHRAVALASDNARRLDLSNFYSYCGAELQAVRDQSLAAVLCNPPIRAGNAIIELLFENAHRCLHDKGELWTVIRTAQGAKSWQKRLGARFGHCDAVAIESGYRVLRCVR